MRSTLAFAALLFLAVTAPAQDDPLPGLVDKLRDTDIEVRDAAEAALIARGESSVPALRRLADAEADPEVRGRLERAIEKITGLEWRTDLDAALRKAAQEKKRVFVLSSPGPLNGPT